MSTKILDNYPEISFIENMTLDNMKEQMLNDFCKKYEEITGKTINLGKADPVRLILYASALQLYQGMQYIDSAAKQSFLKYAYGNYLDNLGALKGIVRNPGVPADTVIRFTLSEARETIVSIPAGTRVTPGGNLFFCTKEESVIPAGDMSTDVSAICTEIGTVGNDYDVGSIRVMVDKLPYIAEAKNIIRSGNGAEVETDENFAERIYLAPSKYSVAGPDDAYKYWVKTYNPFVTDVKVTSPVPGTVDIRFIIRDGEIPSQEMIGEVEQYLREGERRPLTDLVVVSAPEVFKYRVNLKYWINETDKIKEAAIQKNVEEAVDGFVYWQKKQIGRDVNPSMLNYFVMQAGAKRTEITEPVYTVVGDTGIALAVERNTIYGGIECD